MGSLTLPEALALVGLPADTGAEALPVKWHGDRQWRLAGPVRHGDDIVLLYAWISGAPLPAPTPASARTVGALLRRMHDVGAGLVGPGLPVHDKAAAARITLRRIRDLVPAEFIEPAETMIEAAAI
ncbi:MAG TPA: hypothetical protein VHC49_19100, partial [Mycobacteriales bacterium]|nr:hypothetical protein [Mycobacteriales bacterium]